MVNTYEKTRDYDGQLINGRSQLFVSKVGSDGEILESLHGRTIVPEGSGTMYVLDDWVIPQIDKLKCLDGQLFVKDGESLDVPVKTDIELQEENLLKQLSELRARKNE